MWFSIDKETAYTQINKISQRYPHPLEWTTRFKVLEDWKNISLNFFPHALKKWKVELEDIHAFHDKVQRDIDELNMYLDMGVNVFEELEQERIQELIIWLRFLQHAAWIEAEKWGYSISEEDKKTHHNQLLAYSTKLYESPISEHEQEVEIIQNHIDSLIVRSKSKLSEDEQDDFFEMYQELFWSSIPEWSEWSKDALKVDQIFSKKIDAYQLKEIFEMFYDIYGIKKEIIVTPDKHFIDMGENGDFIPQDWQYTIDRALKLATHEIETHELRGRNHNSKLRSKGYLLLEEWLAIFNEVLTGVEYNDLKVKVTPRFVSIFAAENFDSDRLKKFLFLYYKLTGSVKTPEYLEKQKVRLKRYHPNDRGGANRKDVVYFRWFLKVYNMLHGKSFEEVRSIVKQMLISWKTWFHDFHTPVWVDDDTLYPYWIWRIVYQKLNGQRIIQRDLSGKDPIYDDIDALPMNVKRKTIRIIDTIRSMTSGE